MDFSVAKSDYFINRAREACSALPSNVDDSQMDVIPDNYFSPVFLDAYIMSATALEAFINERIAIELIRLGRRIDKQLADSTEINNKKVLESMVEEKLVIKYRMIPRLLWQKSFDESRSPFQDFVTLVSIRNDIIHYKMPFYNEESRQPKWARKLEEKKIILPQPLYDSRIWIEELCTLRGAKWAYNTSCRMMKEFFNLAESSIKETCRDYVEYFEEI